MPKKNIFIDDATMVQVAPIAVTATASSAAIDMASHNECIILLNTGLWVDGTNTFTLEESDASGSGYTTVAAADRAGDTDPVILGVTNDNTLYKFVYTGSKRYVRLTNTVTASPATGLVYGITTIKRLRSFVGTTGLHTQ